MMKKHAYLIIAHKNIEQLQMLVDAIDFQSNDIYIMIDKKSNIVNSMIDKKSNIVNSMIDTKFSNIYFTDRIDIWWGTDSQIEAEMILFKDAYYNKINYDYYHLISGQDYPLASQEEIHNFFDSNPNKEFFTFSGMIDQSDLSVRLHKYLFSKSFRSNNLFIRLIHKIQINLYKLLYKTNSNKKKIYFGSNWCSVDNEFVKYLVDNEQYIKKRFYNGFLADEVYKHQLIMENKHFRDKVYKLETVHDLPEEFQGNLRYINWWDGSPYTWTKDDINALEKARDNGHLFSRKFDYKVDKEIISMINEKLINIK